MTDNFIPPIKTRTTEELLEIVGAPQKWDREAVRLAKSELSNRNVPPIKSEMAKYLSEKRERINQEFKANEGYSVLDFILLPKSTFFEVLFTWELRKDGFDRKARQQKIIRPIIVVIIVIFIVLLNL